MSHKSQPVFDTAQEILKFGVPRYLSLLNRAPGSPHYGCADRYFWKYKYLDYSNFRFQEGALLLTLAAQNQQSPFYALKGLEKLILASIDFVIKQRNRNGSVPESYPLDHSYCATAMLSFAITETLLSFKQTSLPAVESRTSQLSPTIRWLARQTSEVANQLSAATAACYNYYLLTGEKFYRNTYDSLIDRMAQEQTERGCLNEYGGFDLGYSTLSCSLLTHIYRRNHDPRAKEIIKKELDLIDSHLSEYAEFDVQSMSRTTQFIYPYSLMYWKHPAKEKLAAGIDRGRVLHPLHMDDRYFVGLSIDYLFAGKLSEGALA